MNKQQLGNYIFSQCDELRGSVDASVYKDYILGVIFYKWLSVREEEYLREQLFFEDEDFKDLTEENEDLRKDILRTLGYFIPNDYLFQTWYEKGNVTIDVVARALIFFDRLINDEYENNYKGVFAGLQNGLSDLGPTTNEQTNQIRKLIKMAGRIPMINEDYDVLGYVYEYLIGQFAANAGKKAGEFYTPFGPANIIAQIVANHLRNKKEIKVYDPTSGSAALLMGIGKSFVKEGGDFNKVHYYAQELMKSTYNLTRMNLAMKGIPPANINTRNGDTLKDDWPYIQHADESREPLIVDAVVSNPPYSAKWTQRPGDARFRGYGLAPSSKADYAFLLHDLHHLDEDGICGIVLPHGVLFRGNPDEGGEGTIRKNLIENNNIETIIGLPANLFFGTGIPTIIMFLKKKRTSSDVLFIDASKCFEKKSKKNELRECDIKKIVDAVLARKDVEKFARLVSKKEIRENGYNLNIPRYVTSDEESETWDIYSIMNGVVANKEIETLGDIWEAFPTLKGELFEPVNSEYSAVRSDYRNIISNNAEFKKYAEDYREKFNCLAEKLRSDLIDNMETVNIKNEDEEIAKYLFERLENLPLVDKYQVYQDLEDNWKLVSIDLETIRKEGRDSITSLSPVYKIEDGEEVQTGIEGTIIPLEMMKKEILTDKYNRISSLGNEVSDIDSEIENLIGEMPEDAAETLLNEDKDAFDSDSIKNTLKSAYSDINDGEIGALNEYLGLLANKAKKPEKEEFRRKHPSVQWSNIEPSKDGTYSKSNVDKYLKVLYANYSFDENSSEYFAARVTNLSERKKDLNKQIKVLQAEIEEEAKETLTTMSLNDAMKYVELKWIAPLIDDVNSFPDAIHDRIVKGVEYLKDKYAISLFDTEKELKNTQSELSDVISALTGSETDMEGLKQFKALLGDDNEE